MSRFTRTVARFSRQRRGSVPIVVAGLAIPMLMMVGGAVDLGVYEYDRTALQDALDRGTLAAASLNHDQDATRVVESYVRTIPRGGEARVTVRETRTLNSREVVSSATLPYAPAFLGIVGKSDMTITARSTAKDARLNIEISMVLDISGSMQDNGGIHQLRPAAKSFVDTILKPDVRPTTSISIVPFAGQVNVGKTVFDYMVSREYTGEREAYPRRYHSESHCFDLAAKDFAPGLPYVYDRNQTPHFSYYNFSSTNKRPWWCPDKAEVTYLTNDVARLKAGIDALDPYDGTGTAYGMKWAELLLNPSMRPVISAVATRGVPIPSGFLGRPAAFDDKDTLKFIVLMTDGQIAFQPRPTPQAYQGEARTRRVLGGNISRSGWATQNNKDDAFTEAQAVAQYKQVCRYAKDQGIHIFTIAFKVSDSVARTIAECATRQSDAFKVDGLDMDKAFQAIATTIQKVRITE